MKKGAFNKKFTSILAVAFSVLSILNFSSIADIAYAANELPQYEGEASVTVNKNKPTFSSAEITTKSYESYGTLDKKGRCTTAIACIGIDLMPTEERGSIGMVKPTGWKQNKYPGVVESEPAYLYNRCHLIGYQLTGENANTKNLITGTRYLNIEGMLPYENQVADYITSTGNHVMYRVTPVFEGNNLLCSGVQMEAYSVEDYGKGISFNVYCFNVQPGVLINYADGNNEPDKDYVPAKSKTQAVKNTTNKAETQQKQTATASFIGNKNSKKFHKPSCSSVSSMKESNKLYYEGPRDGMVSQGYDPCKRCNP